MDLHYNAFISYRHHPQDIKVAETIHRNLERFKVPKAIKQQGKTIERIFRDKEELPITSSLTDTITMALRNSDYQIVICSTHLKDSYWVQREIDTFLQTHTKDKVLTVLVDGDNPYDVIPEILTYNEVIDPVTGEVTREPIEPLSCDWRLPKRKAMKTELPRLAAVLLGCTYDDLIQRQKQYRQRRLMAGVSTGMAASLALAGYFLYTSIQIQENLNQSLRNQSQYLASTSQSLFQEGDRLTALSLAMEALPNEGNRPYVPAAEQALTEALMLYEADGQLISAASFGADGTIERFVVSDDGKTIYILDDQYNVSVWDTVAYEKRSVFNILGFPTLHSVMLTDNRSNLLTLGGADGTELMCYTPDGTLVWRTGGIEDVILTTDKNLLLAIRKIETDDFSTPDIYELLQLSPDTGEATAEPFGMFGSETLSSPVFAVESCYGGEPVAVRGYTASDGQHVLLVDPAKQTCRDILTFDTLFSTASITEDGKLYVLVTDYDDMSTGRLNNYYFHTKNGGWLTCYNLHSGKELWRSHIPSYNYSETDAVLPIPNSELLFCQYGSAFLQIEAKSGKIVAECHATTIPLTLQMREDRVWVLFTNGCAGTYTFHNNTIGYIEYMENGLLMGHNNNGIYVVPPLSSNVLLYRTISDDSYEAFSGAYEDSIYRLRIHEDLMATYSMNTLQLFDLSAKKLLWQIQPEAYTDMLGFSADSGTLYTRYRNSIYGYDVQSGEVTELALPLATELKDYTTYSNAIALSGDTVCCMIYAYGETQPYILFFDCSTLEYTVAPFIVEENVSHWTAYGGAPVIVHVTDSYALVRIGSGSIYRYDRTTEETTLIAACGGESVFLEDAENDRLVFRTDEGILITDSAGQPILRIPLEDFFAVSFFFYEDTLLCLGSDGVIHRYDLEGNPLGTTALSLYSNFFVQANSISNQNIPVSWAVTPDNEIVVNVFRMGNIINTEHWERTCDVQQMVLYHAPTDCFIAQSNGMIYSYERCSLDDLIARAEEALGSFALTDDQKEYYGLNETSSRRYFLWNATSLLF